MRKINPNVIRTKWTVKELLKTEFPELDWIIPSLMPEGVTILAGRPKAGKSMLAMQIAQAVGSGNIVLNQRVSQGKVLYIAMEDSNRRFRDRLIKQGWDINADVEIRTGWKRFRNSGMDDLRKELKETDYRFCVLDTIYKLLSGNKRERDSEMEPVMSELFELSQKYVAGLLILDHSNKAAALNGIGGESSIMGDTSKAGVADTIWTMLKTSKGMQLEIIGREVEQQTTLLRMDRRTQCWQLLEKKEQIAADSVKGQVIHELEKNPQVSQSDLVLLTGKSQPLISKVLQQLEDEELIERLPRTGVKVFWTPKWEQTQKERI